MTSRQEILSAIRAQNVPPAELPAVTAEGIRYDDPLAQFQRMLEFVGGRFLRVGRLADVPAALAGLPGFATASSVFSLVPGVPSTMDLNRVADPHELESVDWAVMTAEFGVAENGAVWLTDAGLRHRAIYFIVQHLALVLPADQIVHNLHQAYERVTVDGSSLSMFLSGPSKTADIEQSLVIGAHGPRSLTIVCCDQC